ncbi:MAG: DUF1365 domain-containing protein [Kofleriaceae bacterium]
MTRSSLYRGALVHTRRDHVHRTFRYPVFMAAIDLDDARDLDRDLRLFSVDRSNVFSLHARDYTTSLDPSDHAVTRDITSTVLLTNLRFAGYVFNPVSFFLRYAGDELVSVIAEVNNTYGGRHCYTLDASNRIGSRGRRIGFRTTRDFFVSPFLHGPRVYEWWFPAQRDPAWLAITMHVDTPEGARIFTATFAAKRRSLTDRALVGAALRYPFNTAQVIGLIHLEAMKLRFLYKEPYRRPGPDHRPLDM